MLFGSVSKKHVLHRDVSGLDLEKVVKSQSRILNEDLGVSLGLGFYHSIPLVVKPTQYRHPDNTDTCVCPFPLQYDSFFFAACTMYFYYFLQQQLNLLFLQLVKIQIIIII